MIQINKIKFKKLTRPEDVYIGQIRVVLRTWKNSTIKKLFINWISVS